MRRFFISILILSALSSESAINLYENLYCLIYSHAESSLSAYFEDFSGQHNEELAEKLSKKLSEEFSEQIDKQLSEQLKGYTGESCFYDSDISSNVGSIYKTVNGKTEHTGLVDKNISVLQIYNEKQLQNTFNLSYPLSIVLPNEDIILQTSDLSPPAII
ncbi:MAG TPA: hypothetical protein GXX36_07585 [Clostridiaceae bacterium]|nr:hypothetical protein [Clostridiaceae bacterium]